MASITASLPTGRRGQYLAAALAACSVLVVWLAVILPILDWYGSRAAQLTDLRRRAAREAALIEMIPQLKREAATAAQAPTRAVLTGSTDAIAGAALQEQVQSIATAADASLTSIETLPAEQVGAYRRIGVRVELNANLPVIVAMLRAVEDAQPSMLVDDIHLTATPVGPLNAALPLDAAFTVYAFRVGTGKEDTQ
jgi:general secretion pathway protein M